MLFGKRESRTVNAQRRGAYRPKGEDLETRQLMAVDLGGAIPPNLPNVATVPYGNLLAGTVSPLGAGYATANLGDINNDNAGDILIGAPVVRTQGTLIGNVGLSSGAPSAAYLVYGSLRSDGTSVSWATLDQTGQRVSDLAQLGNATQSNPITTNGQTSFAYQGLKFIASQQGTAAQLGASVAAGNLINNTQTFLIGAPGALNSTGTVAGTGRAYLVYADGLTSANLGTSRQVDLDAPQAGVNVVTFVNSNNLAQSGYSVGVINNFFQDGQNAVVIGAPNASFGGSINTGAVYVIPQSSLPKSTTTIDLATVGQNNGVRGIVFTGANSGDLFGWSLTSVGNTMNPGSSIASEDLLVGAPGVNNTAGSAYVIGSNSNFAQFATKPNSLFYITANQIGDATKDSLTNPVPGGIFRGIRRGDFTGYSVSPAGFYLETTASASTAGTSFAIGSPGSQNTAGTVTVIYSDQDSVPSGRFQLPDTVANPNAPLPFEVNVPRNVLRAATFVGANTGDLVGYAVSHTYERASSTATITGNTLLMGAPGVNSNQGVVYTLDGFADNLSDSTTFTGGYIGSYSLRNMESQPLGGTTIGVSISSGTPVTGQYFGASISGQGAQTVSLASPDGLAIQGNYLVGSPAYSPRANVGLPGGVYAVERAAVGGPTNGLGFVLPTLTSITAVNTTTNTATIRVLSNTTTTPAFSPVTDIDQARIIINAYQIPAADVTNFGAVADVNGDGVQEAVFTIPIADIVLRSGITLSTSTLLDIGGYTNTPSTLNSNYFWLGVPGGTNSGGGGTGGGGTGGGSLAGNPLGLVVQTQFLPPFGPDRWTPTVATLSRLGSYKAIPLRVALQQYNVQPGFARRINQYYNPSKVVHQFGNASSAHGGRRTTTLGHAVFTRSKFKAGQTLKFTHKVPVVPTRQQSVVYGPTSTTTTGPHGYPRPKA